MANAKNYSRLLDPIVLKADIATPVKPLLTGLKKLNWKNIFINIIVPICFLLLLAFHLRGRYDKKKQLYEDYFVVDPPQKSIIF